MADKRSPNDKMNQYWQERSDQLQKINYHSFRSFLSNRWLQLLLVLILIALFLLIFSRIAHLFHPVIDFVSVIALPIVLAAILYYLTVPIVNHLEKRGLKRQWGAILVLVLMAIVVLILTYLTPIFFAQSQSLVSNWDELISSYDQPLQRFYHNPLFEEGVKLLNDWGLNFIQGNSINWSTIFNSAIDSIGSIVGVLSNFILAIVTAPFILFYMLKDGPKLKQNLALVVPNPIRSSTMQLLFEMNQQVSAYVRGQIMVGISVAIMFMLGYSIIGLQYGIILGVLAGFLNLIPYLGSFLAMIPAVIIAIVQGPIMVVKVLVVFMIEQTIEGRVISPHILGSNLDIHPVTIMLLLIAGGKLFGILGIIIIIPSYAILKLIFTYFFKWYRKVSGLYEEDLLAEWDSEE
ncbi:MULTISPECIES: AI-2E family transporter [Aerococcus]|uniref:AI-2E family transporter n=1 Tax=Aerococcus sanguinicola TaxID=119206 RepID=A0A5N1GL97_9LACT|nr:MULTISPECIES: AI-2E family transporter [Aerococcus]KAA9301755.1 AI-2E family transporter [Aerococcus sanguinicola]MDK6368829.1 AI-2E family transporter [Aerococcus sp. UMB9870]MDK6680167.1 AI-2E family transporter [Aerococcus sp. UMB8608]MDK6685728.1 AI-2E family transporter [Aerococcus sp. UMB8623]MDK6939453.1 AI-2E family transporter [Aerococcus sp. UMB8487]